MERFIAEHNIAHYRELLATELEADERAVIEKLLVEEEKKLARLGPSASSAPVRGR